MKMSQCIPLLHSQYGKEVSKKNLSHLSSIYFGFIWIFLNNESNDSTSSLLASHKYWKCDQITSLALIKGNIILLLSTFFNSLPNEYILKIFLRISRIYKMSIFQHASLMNVLPQATLETRWTAWVNSIILNKNSTTLYLRM